MEPSSPNEGLKSSGPGGAAYPYGADDIEGLGYVCEEVEVLVDEEMEVTRLASATLGELR